MTLTNIWNYLWKALFNNDEGFSVRKATGVMFAVFIVILTACYTTENNFEYVLTNYLATILTLFGITHLANAAKRKTEMKEKIALAGVNPTEEKKEGGNP